MGVAQLVEHRTVAPDVAGSIPVSHPKTEILWLCEEDTPFDFARGRRFVRRRDLDFTLIPRSSL